MGCLHFLGRGLGLVELVSVTIYIGLAVDYCLHIGYAFVEVANEYKKGEGDEHANADSSPLKKMQTRRLALMGSLHRVGEAVLSGGVTTVGSSVLLLGCVLHPLSLFGMYSCALALCKA
jgi:predicted RND superfamily exporter protein